MKQDNNKNKIVKILPARTLPNDDLSVRIKTSNVCFEHFEEIKLDSGTILIDDPYSEENISEKVSWIEKNFKNRLDDDLPPEAA